MSRRVKISGRKKTIVYEENDKMPFWIEHIGLLIVGGLVVVVGGIVALSLSDWGRATMVWIGIGLGVVMAAWLAIDPWRSFRSGEPVAVWAGEALSAIGWSGMTVSLAAGLPLAFTIGMDGDALWVLPLPGVGAIAFTAIAMLGVRLQTSRPLPALDRTPRTARVVFTAVDGDGGQTIEVRYRGVDGKKHDAELADLIDDSWEDCFARGTTWQVYAFRDPQLADSVVFLTEAHDDVWRDGYKLNGVRLGGEGGPVKPGPGSPFLRDGAKWRFER